MTTLKSFLINHILELNSHKISNGHCTLITLYQRQIKHVWFLRRNLWRCPVAVKQKMYFTLVRPLLEYASSVWDPHTTSDIHKIEMVQHRAARFVIGNYSKTSGTVTNILQQLNWPTLEQRRKESRLINLYKIQHENIAIPFFSTRYCFATLLSIKLDVDVYVFRLQIKERFSVDITVT